MSDSGIPPEREFKDRSRIRSEERLVMLRGISSEKLFPWRSRTLRWWRSPIAGWISPDIAMVPERLSEMTREAASQETPNQAQWGPPAGDQPARTSAGSEVTELLKARRADSSSASEKERVSWRRRRRRRAAMKDSSDGIREEHGFEGALSSSPARSPARLACLKWTWRTVSMKRHDSREFLFYFEVEQLKHIFHLHP